MDSSEPQHDIRTSQLFQDLQSEHRDTLYRAMHFIGQHGGPVAPGDILTALISHRTQSTSWLLDHETPEDLVTEYAEFRHNWSPVFPD